MGEGEDFLYRPVLAQVLSPQSLDDGSIDLWGITLLNEALDVRAENEWRIQEHFKPKS